MNNITVEKILENPFKYEDMLVHVKYRTYWQNKGNQMRQETVCFTGRLSFISTSLFQIEKSGAVVTVPLGYFIEIIEAMPPIDYSRLAYENYELKNKISRLKELLEAK